MRLIALILLSCAAPTLAAAQTWPGWPAPPPPGYDPHQAAAEQHRLAIEQLRRQADQREGEAQRQRLQSALTIQRLEGARPPAPALPPPAAHAPPPAPAGQAARAAGEIDAWLARRPH